MNIISKIIVRYLRHYVFISLSDLVLRIILHALLDPCPCLGGMLLRSSLVLDQVLDGVL